MFGKPVKKVTEEHVIDDEPKPEDDELVREALKVMRKFNAALADCARRGWSIELNVDRPQAVRRVLKGSGTNDTKYDAVFVRPARVTARDISKPKVNPE